MSSYVHETVMPKTLIDAIKPVHGTCAVDCTLGGGGHTRGLLDSVGEDGFVIAIDQDVTAIENAKRRFQNEISQKQLFLVHGPFSKIREAVEQSGNTRPISAVCADIGVSSIHFDDASRGFSFRNDGPLDMRMNQTSNGPTAADIVNSWSLDELTKMLREFGEEPRARAIATGIVKERANAPIDSTKALSSIVERCAKYAQPSKKHLATKTFQALRIVVNDELGELRALLDDSFDILGTKGRLGIISFHSLEDRMVKSHFVSLSDRAKERQPLKGAPMTESELQSFRNSPGSIVKPFPFVATDDEIFANPRARSAKLRVIEKNYL